MLAALWLAQPLHTCAAPADDASPEQEPASGMAETAEAEETTNTAAAPATQEESSSEEESSGGINREAMVVFGQNAELKAGDTAQVVVVIGGSAKIHGKVREAVVVVGGDAEIDGEVQQEVVAVMGSVRLLPGAVVHRDVVSVGGRLSIAEGAKVKGHAQEVAVAGLRMPRADWIQQWLEHCAFLLRPLAPQVGWVWLVALVYFLVFLLIAAVFRHPVQVCLEELERRPATTFIVGLLTKLLLPLLIFILIVIVVGIVVVPFLMAALIVLGLVGKVAVLEWIGFRAGGLAGKSPVQQPVVALVIGAVILAVLYMIPVIGLLTMLLLSVWSLGCAISAAFRGFRRELPEREVVSLGPPPTPVMPVASGFGQHSSPEMSFSAGAPQASPAQGTATATLTEDPPVLPDSLAYPKATFWERMAAGFLDLVLVTILGAIVQGPPLALVVALAYFAGLWAWRGTTIGGIVIGLKVVRMDGQQLSFVVALVRGLAAGFSAVVLFLGFFWIAWDPDRQGWHDKIAGTAVLRLPKGTPLLCV